MTLTKNKYMCCHSCGTSYGPGLVLLPHLLLELCLILLLVLIQIHWEWGNLGFISGWESLDPESLVTRSGEELIQPHKGWKRREESCF